MTRLYEKFLPELKEFNHNGGWITTINERYDPMKESKVKFSRGACVQWFAVGRKKHMWYSNNTACHADLRRLNIHITDWSPSYIVTAPRRQSGDYEVKGEEVLKSQEVYWDWLLHRSPWAKVFMNPSVEHALEYGFITRTNVPAKVLVSACHAIRIWEYPLRSTLFSKLVGAGCNPNMSYLAILRFQEVGDRLQTVPLGGHTGITDSAVLTDNYKRFVRGDYWRKEENYSKQKTFCLSEFGVIPKGSGNGVWDKIFEKTQGKRKFGELFKAPSLGELIDIVNNLSKEAE